jgi:hypothetical protein
MDNTGTKMEAAVKEQSGTREQKARESGASRRAPNATTRANALFAKFGDAGTVGRWKRSHHDIDVWQSREHFQPYDFAKPAFHTVAVDRRVRILRNDDTRSGMTQKGSDVPNLKMRGSDSLPLQADRLERAFPR